MYFHVERSVIIERHLITWNRSIIHVLPALINNVISNQSLSFLMLPSQSIIQGLQYLLIIVQNEKKDVNFPH
jgi:hypothetical protein